MSINGREPRAAIADRADVSSYLEAGGSQLVRPGEWIRETRVESGRLTIYPEGDFTEIRVKTTTDIVSPAFWRRHGVTAIVPVRQTSGPDTTRAMGTWSSSGYSVKLSPSREALAEMLYELGRSMAAMRGLSPEQVITMEAELRAVAEEQASRLLEEGGVKFQGIVVGDRFSGRDSNGLELVFRRANPDG